MLIVIAGLDPDYPIVVAGNRDELRVQCERHKARIATELDFMCKATLFHRTQYNDMHRVRSNRPSTSDWPMAPMGTFRRRNSTNSEATLLGPPEQRGSR